MLAMAANQEIELKRRLIGADAAERLLQVLGPVASDVEQVNHVFDTPDQRLRQARYSFRLREQGASFILTAKGPTRDVSASVGSRTEAEAEIDEGVARRLLAGEGDALGELRRRATAAAFEALWEGIERARSGRPLEEVGLFHNRRRTVRVAVTPALSVNVEVDATRFPNGKVEEEVEIEIAGPELASEVEAWLEERAAAAGVETQPSTSKLARFYAVLDAVTTPPRGSSSAPRE